MKKILAGLMAITLSFVAVSGHAQARSEDGQKGRESLKMSAEIKGEQGKYGNETRKNSAGLEVSIGDNGRVSVKGAKVLSVSGNVISAVTGWGSASIAWKVSTDANSKLINKNGTGVVMTDFVVGDLISFKGEIDEASPALSVKASVVKKMQAPLAKTTVEGVLKSISGTSNLVVSVNGSDYTVNLMSDTSVVNNAWLKTALSNFKIGDKVRVYGLVGSGVINATVIRGVNI